jgi:hypothetical protein
MLGGCGKLESRRCLISPGTAAGGGGGGGSECVADCEAPWPKVEASAYMGGAGGTGKGCDDACCAGDTDPGGWYEGLYVPFWEGMWGGGGNGGGGEVICCDAGGWG